jgi:DNA polymerase
MRSVTPSPSLAYIPPDADHEKLARAVQECRGCDLYKRATQGVMGEGPVPAPLMLVGEQPGDQEDQRGHPFVGPAGRILDRALDAADIPRESVYVTNAVKHFKWEPRGKRRLHSKPNAFEIHACQGWLESELGLVRPRVIVCLGATAAQVFLGRSFSVTQRRGEAMEGAPWATWILATYHPSAILRADDETRDEMMRQFEDDVERAGALAIAARSSSARTRHSGLRGGRDQTAGR